MDRGPSTLLPVPAARLAGFALLGTLGAVEWSRMVEGLSAGRAITWVIAGIAAAALVLAADNLNSRLRGPLTLVATLVGLLAAFAVSGIELALLKPARWGELGENVGRGAEALGGVRLPYQGEDPWPALTMQLIGSLLCTLAALLAIWPRGRTRGYPLVALSALLVLVVSPVVSLGGSGGLMLGAVVAALTAGFLFLERLPVRPGAGAAALLIVATMIALPIGAAADREEPWFDYRTFAESLGPSDPVRFAWNHEYGPIDWPREGVELFRVAADEPFYWKAETLDEFDGSRWRISRRGDPDGELPTDDLPFDWRDRPGWTERFAFTLRRLETTTVVGAGTIVDVLDSSRAVEHDLIPGRWIAPRELGRGDSYELEAHIPRPSVAQLGAATAGLTGRQSDALRVGIEIREEAAGELPHGPPSPFAPEGVPPERAVVQFRPYGQTGVSAIAEYTRFDTTGNGARAMRASTLERTYALAQRLKRGTSTPYEYVLRVNSFLRSDAFRYSERPLRDGRALGLDEFLNEVRAGYCQHYSGAMTLLLRMGGVPARVATGFTPGGFRKRIGEWVVRDTDAHSWVEVWFDDLGWVTVDPTPPATPARSQVALIEPTTLPPEIEAVTGETPADPQARRPEGPVREPVGGGQAVDTREQDGGGLPWLPIVLGLLALAAIGVGVRRLRNPRAPRSEETLERAIEELQRALRRAGRPAATGVTLRQLEARFGGAAYLQALRAARYAGGPPPDIRARRAFRRELAAGLGWRGWLLALWALPPRIRS